jgi:threonylcarbamoyladenosine tRNA methylthiotransferase MtaB
MRRPYRSDRAWQAVHDAAAVDPLMGIGADIIVGFPGETEAEFEDTRRMVDALPFTYLHVFRYSPRPGTPAADEPAVHPEAVSERSRVLRDLAATKREAFQQALVGVRREAVIENPDDRDPSRRLATTDNYAPVSVQSDLPAGTLIDVEPHAWQDGRLVAGTCRVLREVPA